jgi:hypothetical protein
LADCHKEGGVTGDRDLAEIVRVAGMAREDAEASLVRSLVNHCVGVGYQTGVHPALIAKVAALNVAAVLFDDVSMTEWDQVCGRVATLLELEAHGEAAA